MLDNSASLSSTVLDPATGLYLYDYDPVYERVHEECYESTFAEVEALYRLAPAEDLFADEFTDDHHP